MTPNFHFIIFHQEEELKKENEPISVKWMKSISRLAEICWWTTGVQHSE